MIEGHCECGRVRFEVKGDIQDLSHCHCSQCRRLHGAAFASFAEVARKDFRYVSGESDVKVFASSAINDRVFCANCGSNILVASSDAPEFFYLAMGTVDGDPQVPVAYHEFVGSKASWYDITDDLDQYREARTD